MAGERLDERVPKKPKPDKGRVRRRAAGLSEEESSEGVENAERATEALLEESDARTDADPAPRDIDDDRVDRRKSEDTTPPPDLQE